MARQRSISTTLLDRIRGQEADGWARLVALFTPTLSRWCRDAGVPEADLDDVVQEVFVSVARSILNFRREGPNDSFGAWLRRIARNRSLDSLRRGRRRKEVLPGDDLPEPEAHAPGFSAEEVAEIYAIAAEQARAEFAPRVFRAFEQTALEGRPAREVAEELGMTRAAVYQARHRVYLRLRADLRDLV